MKQKSPRYLNNQKIGSNNKLYTIRNAVDLLYSQDKAKFDESIDLNVRLKFGGKNKKEVVRGSILLPFGNGKKIKIIVFSSLLTESDCQKFTHVQLGDTKLIDQILSSKQVSADIIIASPDFMPKLAKIAKIIGPKGLMPSPKKETVTTDPLSLLTEITKGKSFFASDIYGNIALTIGKSSFKIDAVINNIQVFVDYIRSVKNEKNKNYEILNCSISSTMGTSFYLKV